MQWWRERGYTGQRTQQHCGKAGDNDVDIFELPNFHIESKGMKGSKLSKSTLLKWYEQLEADCPSHKYPFIQFTANGKEPLILLPFTRTVGPMYNFYGWKDADFVVEDSVEAHRHLASQQLVKETKKLIFKDIDEGIGGIFFRLNSKWLFYIHRAEVLEPFISEFQKSLLSAPKTPLCA